MEKIAVPGIKDFGKVNDYLYRGAQPKDDSLAQLKKMGIDTVIDLRGVLHEAADKERTQAQGLGMQFVNLPGNGWTNPTDEQIAQFFSLILERPRRTIFIHCWLGGDRSGMFIAAYRIAFDGWTAEQAVDEMREFHYLEFWHPGMKRYVKGFPDRLAHSPALARFRQMPHAREHVRGYGTGAEVGLEVGVGLIDQGPQRPAKDFGMLVDMLVGSRR